MTVIGLRASSVILGLALTGCLISAGPTAQADDDDGPPTVIGSVSVVDPSTDETKTLVTRSGRVDLELSSRTSGLWVKWGEDPLPEVAIGASIEAPLRAGLFPNVDSAYPTGTGPGLEVFRTGHGATIDHGFVDIRDIAFDDLGAITRFEIAFPTSVRNVPTSAFGTMRMNEPDPTD